MMKEKSTVTFSSTAQMIKPNYDKIGEHLKSGKFIETMKRWANLGVKTNIKKQS